MQSNTAAFEGWSLALHRWCGANVKLCWSRPADEGPKSIIKLRHYRRFLYRVQRFRQLFPWFSVGSIELLDEFDLGKGIHYLNTAGSRPPLGPGSSKETGSAEHDLELSLSAETDTRLTSFYGMSAAALRDRQIPVGLFKSPIPSKSGRVFPGGKGAIDLVALDGEHLWIFELKAGDNVSVGTLSELFFYTSLLRDLANDDIRLANIRQDKAIITHTVLSKLKIITGVMMGQKLHPLIADAGLFQILNEAVDQVWNQAGPRVSFRADLIDPAAQFGLRRAWAE